MATMEDVQGQLGREDPWLTALLFFSLLCFSLCAFFLFCSVCPSFKFLSFLFVSLSVLHLFLCLLMCFSPLSFSFHVFLMLCFIPLFLHISYLCSSLPPCLSSVFPSVFSIWFRHPSLFTSLSFPSLSIVYVFSLSALSSIYFPSLFTFLSLSSFSGTVSPFTKSISVKVFASSPVGFMAALKKERSDFFQPKL